MKFKSDVKRCYNSNVKITNRIFIFLKMLKIWKGAGETPIPSGFFLGGTWKKKKNKKSLSFDKCAVIESVVQNKVLFSFPFLGP